jgi:hypothetical protein
MFALMIWRNRMKRAPSRSRLPVLGLLAALAVMLGTAPALANVTVTEVSSDPFTNSTSQHATEVEPDSFTAGNTSVAAVQQGRFYDGGASDLGFATSTNGGATWTSGSLPGLTTFDGGSYNAVSDPVVAFDPKHGVWLISGLAITTTSGVVGAAVTVNRSTDGGLTWGNAINAVVASGGASLDKDWITCDASTASSYYGNCYAEYDNNGGGNRIYMATSTDGGMTWHTVQTGSTGLGGQPMVQHGGTVIVPYLTNNGQIRSFRSVNGGSSWSSSVAVATVRSHTVAGGIRTSPLPSAQIDATGKVYVVWQDCRFQSGCAGNDIVMSTSANGTSWSTVTRVTSDGGDHFIPGIGVDATTSGSSAKIAVAYYRYPTSNCTASTCQLTVGYASSVNGGTSWSAPTQLAGPMTLSWLASTNQGVMVGDYIATSVVSGVAWPAMVIAAAPSGGTFNEALYEAAGGLQITGGALRAAATPLVTSGHQPTFTVPPRAR